ncbi:hypothetical protein DICPUDRAFT_54584 [Dictyostelium purpureum]|uniref:2,3-bisphosphoglycerate 3-phosphatase n=1 Tax=Dictyostelium purpureum TaxID=5786 RepID=F0ZHT7_DICPU|nr:uncharacterized protein DICPUDRAFT_54584 [Dictyostelium purpureum]EGC36480.1 hypothetical protein DICPUDRAFT_54584 [Dictyostelium purpureum]|eukprot:XP_003286993.1 hypothetical protein DICPUDRAFT_54584 [Dictyostelium purpureum]
MKINNIIVFKIIFYFIFVPIILSSNSIKTKENINIFNSNNNINNKYINFKQNYDIEFLNKHLTTKTPYHTNGFYNSNSFINPIPNCKLVSMDIVLRHGSRYPEIKILNKFDSLKKEIQKIKSLIVGEEFEWLRNYEIPYQRELAGNLIELGNIEHYNISKRLLEKHPNYFETPYSPQSYKISSTIIPRTGVSASSFSYGLFEGTGKLPGNFQPVHIQTSNLENDNLLSFFLNCKKYTDKLKDGSISENEEAIWKQMKYPLIAREISERLGLSGKWLPSNSIVQSIFLSCVYQVAIDNISDQFCSLLSKENILDWEYAKDLSTYWVNGYGNDINYEISSLLLKDIFNHFDNIINNVQNNSTTPQQQQNKREQQQPQESQEPLPSKDIKDEGPLEEFDKNENSNPKNIFRFGHSETLVPFMSLLGLFKDGYHIYANSTLEQIKNRKFKTSLIVPYATNIGMFLYDCGNGQNSDFKILVKHNESPILVPGCDDYYCSFNDFKSLFPKVLNFDWDSYCNNQ